MRALRTIPCVALAIVALTVPSVAGIPAVQVGDTSRAALGATDQLQDQRDRILAQGGSVVADVTSILSSTGPDLSPRCAIGPPSEDEGPIDLPGDGRSRYEGRPKCRLTDDPNGGDTGPVDPEDLGTARRTETLVQSTGRRPHAPDGDPLDPTTDGAEIPTDTPDRRGALPWVVSALLLALPIYRLYRRLQPDEILDHEVRRRIVEHLGDDQGATAADLADAFDLHYKTVRHHLEVLEEFDHVIAHPVGGRTYYFPADSGGSRRERRLRALMDSGVRREIVRTLRRRGPVRGQDLADHMDLARSTLSYHLDRLAGAGLVTTRDAGRAVIYDLDDTVSRSTMG